MGKRASIRRLRLGNWRNFKKVDLEFRDRTFVCGPNASGKTNLLDALRFLRDIALPGGSFVNALLDRRGISHLRSLHAGNRSAVEIEVELEVEGDPHRWAYKLAFSGSVASKKPLKIDHESVRHGDSLVLSRPERSETDPLLLSQTHLEQASQNIRFRPLVEALASIVTVHVVPQVVRTPSRDSSLSRREAPGSDFIFQLARLADGTRKSALKRIEKQLKKAVPRFSELRVERDDEGTPHLEAKFENWRPQGGWQNEQEFSDGTLRLVGLLWAIDQGSAPLLLEEPELSLHREIIRQLPRVLAAASHRSPRQVFVTTHAEEMLSDRGIDPSEIVLIEVTGHESKAILGTDRPELVRAVRAGIPLSQVVSSVTKPIGIEQLPLALSGSRR